MKNNKGITLVSVVITILILIIIAGVTISRISIKKEEVTDEVLESEIRMVQSTIVMQYQKYITIKDEELLIGDKCTKGNFQKNGIELSDEEISKYQSDEYYRILNSSDLISMGINRAKDIFIVNYKTGEVLNLTSKKADETELKLEGT